MQIYRVEGIRVVVVDVITWTIKDPITVSNDAGVFLERFSGYSSSLPQQYDSAMLFTYVFSYTSLVCTYDVILLFETLDIIHVQLSIA